MEWSFFFSGTVVSNHDTSTDRGLLISVYSLSILALLLTKPKVIHAYQGEFGLEEHGGTRAGEVAVVWNGLHPVFARAREGHSHQ